MPPDPPTPLSRRCSPRLGQPLSMRCCAWRPARSSARTASSGERDCTRGSLQNHHCHDTHSILPHCCPSVPACSFLILLHPAALTLLKPVCYCLSRIACHSLGQLAYVSPSSVLPLVVARFRSALESETATTTLAAGITTLAYCVRPMLLSGWPGPNAEESGPQVRRGLLLLC